MEAQDHITARGALMPLFWLSLAFTAGILLASQFPQPVTTWLGMAGFALLAALFFRRRGDPHIPVLRTSCTFLSVILVSGALGAARFQASLPQADPFFIAWYNDREYELLVTGTLVEPPDYRDSYTNLRLQVEGVDTGEDRDLPVKGLILVRVPANQDYRYGDRVRLRGKLQTPPENEEFSYRDYLARQGIHAYMPKARPTRLPWPGGNPLMKLVYGIKERSLENIYRLFPDPEASLMAGILLGVESGLPPRLQEAFKNTGTAHIIAISGFNIAIIAGLFVSLFSRLFGQRWGAVAAIAGIALYTLLVGADAAVVRAAIMGGLSLFARQVGRRQQGLNTLAFTGAAMAVANPHVPWDIGFQLSFGATLGLILYAEPFANAFLRFVSRFMDEEKAVRVAGPVSEYILFTLAAQLATLPIMAYHFQRISLVSLIANPFILPAQPAVMIVGGLAVLASLVYLPLGQLIAIAAWPFPAYSIRVVDVFDRLPHGVIVLGEFSLLFVILFYAVLFGLTFFKQRLEQFRTLLPPSLAASALLVVAFLTWRSALSAPDGRLHLTFLSVGSADAVLVQTPGGRSLLVNGGPSVSRLSEGLGRRLPPFQRGLDFLVVASTQEQQVSALPRLVDRFPPAAVLWSGKTESSYSAGQLTTRLVAQGVPVTQAEPGQALDLGQGASMRVLATGPRGAVLLVEWGSFRALLPVGISFSNLEGLENGAAVGPVSLLLLAESGYSPVNPPAWIENLRPQLVILSVAAGDQEGLPHDQVIESLQGYPLLRTDQNGWIRVSTDGDKLWVEVERK